MAFQDSTACSSERKECNCDRAKVLPGPHAILGSGLIKGKNSLDALIASNRVISYEMKGSTRFPGKSEIVH